MFDYILERAKEPSTWRGAILLATAGGLSVAPDLANAVVSFGIATAGLIGVVTKDK